MTATIRLPPLEEIARRWCEIEPILKRATDRTRGCYAPVHVLQEIMAGGRGMWFVEFDGELVALAVAGAEQYPTGWRCWLIPYVASRPEDTRAAEWWPALMAEMERERIKNRCNDMRSSGRLGWRRFSRSVGVDLEAMAEVLVRAG